MKQIGIFFIFVAIGLAKARSPELKFPIEMDFVSLGSNQYLTNLTVGEPGFYIFFIKTSWNFLFFLIITLKTSLKILSVKLNDKTNFY